MSIPELDITAWEHNIYNCGNCGYYWIGSFPIRNNVTLITEEDLYCGKCGCVGKIVQTQKIPTLIGKLKNAS